MTNLEAKKRYYRVSIPAVTVFLAASLVIAWMEMQDIEPSLLTSAFAIVPVVALLSLFWAHWRFMNEIDEFLRSIQIQAVLAGLAFILVVATGWGYLELYVDAPRLHMFWLNPIFWIVYAIAAVYLTWRSTEHRE
jgi:hypothetical protein